MIGTRLYDAFMVGHPADRRTHEELAPMIRRPLAALASVVLTVLGVVFLLPDCASACSCAIPGSQEERAERALAESSAVFSGEAVEVEEGPRIKMMGIGGLSSSRVTLRASEVWKGPQRETLEVSTPRDEASCGFPFKEGQEYLVYAYTGKQGLEVDLCGETIPLSEAGVDLAVLGDGGEKPKDGEVLSDTSGGVSVRAMAGLAGLALAASLLVAVRLVRTG
jgi:hypothetical protein